MPDDEATTPAPTALQFLTSDGISLVGELAPAALPTACAVICHPHPLHGGSMHAPVGDALFRALPSHGVSCLRFNFRGVEGSEGSHDEGIGEQLDVAAAIEALSESVDEQLPLFVSGWSFGADMALASDAERVAGWIGVAPPLRMLEPEAYRSGADNRPKLLLVPEHDQFNPPSSATERTSEWNQTSIVTVPQADHFLAGKLSVVVDEAASFILTNT